MQNTHKDQFAFLPYNKALTTLARENRKNPTPAENHVWQTVLRRRFCQYKFLRQKPIGNYIVDFYCSQLALVIELDGDSHLGREEYDTERTRFLNALSLTVLRYRNEDVLCGNSTIMEDMIRVIAQKPSPDKGRWRA